MKIILIFLFLLSMISNVVGQSMEKPFIEVRGMAKIERTVKTYIIDIVITEDSSDSEEKRSLDQLKKTFLDKAKAAGFDTGRFKENKLSYALVQYGSYGTNGTTYSVETASSEEIMALNQLIDNKSGSVSIIARRVTYLPVKDFSRIIAAALTNGKERAEKVAALMGEKLGILQTVIDYSVTNEEVEDTDHYRPDEDKYYILSLKYLIE